jgi:hypothetical protein
VARLTRPRRWIPPSAAEHHQAERDEHERERARGRDVERERELGEDLGREGLVPEDLEGAVLGEQAMITSTQPPRMATRACPIVTRQKVFSRPAPRLRDTSSCAGSALRRLAATGR